MRLQFIGSAQSQYSRGLPLVDVVPSFDIVVRDAQGNILSSWQGLLARSNVGFDFSVDTRVGDSLQFSVSHPNPRADRVAEFQGREAAALAWIDAVFEQATASKSAGVLIAIQAHPNFELASTAQQRLGFNAVLARLGERSKSFGKPVLLAHGDSDYFRLDKPLVLPVAPSGAAQLENFTRLENFGSPSMHWVEVLVDARDPNVFSVVPRIVKGNLFARLRQGDFGDLGGLTPPLSASRAASWAPGSGPQFFVGAAVCAGSAFFAFTCHHR